MLGRAFAVFLLSAALFAPAAFPQTAASASQPVAVSADLLRHPIREKVRRRLMKALKKMESGEHETAIEQLRETLAKYPDSAPYVDNLLGVEYVKTDRFQEAVTSFEQAVSWLPKDAMTHYNFGLALVCAGDYERAAHEVRRAVELDPGNPQMQARLNALLENQR